MIRIVKSDFNWPLCLGLTLGVIVLSLLFAIWAEGAEEICIDCIIQIESGGNPNAVSPDGCIGLMQISEIVYIEFKENHNDEFWRSTRIDCLYHPEINKDIGSWYILYRIPQMLKAYGIPDCIDYRLMAYNWGIGNLNKWWKSDAPAYSEYYIDKPVKYYGIPEETRNYIKRYHKCVDKK